MVRASVLWRCGSFALAPSARRHGPQSRQRTRSFTALGLTTTAPPARSTTPLSPISLERRTDEFAKRHSGRNSLHINQVAQEILTSSDPHDASAVTDPHISQQMSFSVLSPSATATATHSAPPDLGTPWSALRVEAALARYAHTAFASRPLTTSTREGLTPHEQEEIRQLLDYVTHSFHEHHQQQITVPLRHRQWVGPACRLASAVGLHSRCCELFFASVQGTRGPREGMPTRCESAGEGDRTAARTVGEQELGMPSSVQEELPEYVLSAAVAARDFASLDLCFRYAQEVHADTLVLKAPAVEWCGSVGVASALRVYCGCVSIFNASLCMGKMRKSDADAARELALRIAAWLRLGSADISIGDKKEEERELREANAFFAASARLARYARNGQLSDEAPDATSNEVHARAAICLQAFRHWGETQPRTTPWRTTELLCAMLRSALAARRWDLGRLYAMHVDLHLSTLPMLTPAEDILVALVLRLFVLSRQPSRGVAWLARLREAFPAYLPSVSTGVVIARLVGATASDNGGGGARVGASLALWSLEIFLDAAQPTPPTSQELFDSVCALARCGLPNFTAIVDSLVDNGLLTISEEERLYARLLHCRGSVHWRTRLEGLLQETLSTTSSGVAAGSAVDAFSLEAPGATADPQVVRRLFSPRNAYMVLLIMQEGEHPFFMTYYRFFLLRVAVPAPGGPSQLPLTDRVRWAMFATVWSTARAGRLPKEDLLYVAREVAQLLHPQARSSAAAVGLPASLRHSLEAKWSVLYAQFSPQWWRRHTARGPTTRSLTLAVVPPSASTETPFPVARFLKRKTLLRLSDAPAALYRSTTREVAAHGIEGCNCPCESVAVLRDIWRSLYDNGTE